MSNSYWHLLKISKKNNIQIVKLINTGKKKDNLILNIIEFFLIKLFNLNKINSFFNNKGIFLKLFSRLNIRNIKILMIEILLMNKKK